MPEAREPVQIAVPEEAVDVKRVDEVELRFFCLVTEIVVLAGRAEANPAGSELDEEGLSRPGRERPARRGEP